MTGPEAVATHLTAVLGGLDLEGQDLHAEAIDFLDALAGDGFVLVRRDDLATATAALTLDISGARRDGTPSGLLDGYLATLGRLGEVLR